MSTTLVDAHVHFYESFHLPSFLNAAVSNLQQIGNHLAMERVCGCLLLTQISPGDPLELLNRQCDRLAAPWELLPSDESDSIVFAYRGHPVLAVVSGRQLVCAERIEVLALACRGHLSSGLPLADTVQAISAAGGIPVLPWAFGKWWFGRGRKLKEFLQTEGIACDLFLGDNGCRPSRLGRPKMLSWYERHGVRVLGGSDPLPLPTHQRRVASYVSALPGLMDWRQPAQWFRKQVTALRTSPPALGHCRSLTGFLQDQICVRMPKAKS